MDTYTQKNRNISIAINGFGPDDFLLAQLKGSEGFSELFSYKLGLLGKAGTTSKTVIGKEAVIKLVQDDGSIRYFDGIITRFACKGKYKKAHDLSSCTAVLSPKLWLLQKSYRCRVFHEKSVIEIVDQVLKFWGIEYDDSKVDKNNLKKLEHCVQYNESDFHFISRIMEEVGIYYYFEHGHNEKRSYHKMILANQNPQIVKHHKGASEQEATPQLTYAPSQESGDNFYHWQMGEYISVQKLELDDYNFRDSTKDYLQSASTNQKTGLKHATKLQYDNFLGRFRNVKNRSANMNSYGELLTTIDNQITKSNRIKWNGKTKNKGITVGQLFILKDFPDHSTLNVLVRRTLIQAKTSPYLPSEMTVSQDEHFVFDCTVFGHDNNVTYSSPKKHVLPRIHSLERAVVVTDTADPELLCDKYGRVKIEFKWSGKKDNEKSYWARTLSNSAGANFGQVMLPTKGQEVMVCFEDGNPDYPIIVGCVYNDQNMPPVKLDDPNLKYANINRGRTVDSDGNFVDNIDSSNVENYPAIMNIDDLNSSDNQKQYNEISVYNMQSSFKEQGWPSGDSTYELRATCDMFGGDLSSVANDEDTALLRDIASYTKKDSFEGINLYSNNQILSQASQDQVIQAGRNLVLEAGNTIVLKVGRATLTMRDGGITVREACMTEAKSLWEIKDATGHMLTFDSSLIVRPLESQLYGTYSYLTAFVSNAVDTPWGASMTNTLFTNERNGTVLKDKAGGIFNMLSKISKLSVSLYHCMPDSVTDDVFESSSSSEFSEICHCAFSAVIIATIIKMIYEDISYFFTIKEALIKITPKSISVDAGTLELKGNPALLNGNPLAGYDTTISDTAGIDITEIDDLLGSEIYVDEESIDTLTTEETHTALGDQNNLADERTDEILSENRSVGDSSEEVLAREDSIAEYDGNILALQQEVASMENTVAERTDVNGVEERTVGSVTEEIGAREAIIGADIETE